MLYPSLSKFCHQDLQICLPQHYSEIYGDDQIGMGYLSCPCCIHRQSKFHRQNCHLNSTAAFIYNVVMIFDVSAHVRAQNYAIKIMQYGDDF